MYQFQQIHVTIQEIHISILKNPCNKLEKSTKQLRQIKSSFGPKTPFFWHTPKTNVVRGGGGVNPKGKPDHKISGGGGDALLYYFTNLVAFLHCLDPC